MALSISYRSEKLSLSDKAALISKAGFTHIGLYYNEFTDSLQCAEVLAAANLSALYVHAAYTSANGLWDKNSDAVGQYCAFIDKCAPLKPQAIVFHASNGLLLRFDGIEDNVKRLLAAAESCGVVVAFENLWGLKELEYIFSRIEHPLLKVCYDAGHENALGPLPYDVISAFGSKIAVTHLHDNLGRVYYADSDDLHLLPFDGKIDWQAKMNALSKAAPNVVLNLEVHKYKLSTTTDEDFIQEAYKRAQSLTDYFERI